MAEGYIKCRNNYCYNGIAPRGRSPYCSKCKIRKTRENNPLTSAYRIKKSSAKRKGIYFDLTLEQFKEFCDKYKYLELKGTGADDLTMDRIIPYKDAPYGYTATNIQALTNAQNVKKAAQDIKKYGFSVRVPKLPSDPF